MNKKQPIFRKLSIVATLILLQHTSQKLKPSKDNVVFLVELGRHGVRSPRQVLREAPWTRRTEHGQLTPIGQRQRYMVGLNTLHRYKSLFKFKNGASQLKSNEYRFRAGLFSRVRDSAFSQIFGMFNKTKQIGGPEIPFKDNFDKRMDPPQQLLFDKEKEIDFLSPLPRFVDALAIHTVDMDTDDWLIGVIEPGCAKNFKVWKGALKALGRHLNHPRSLSRW